MNKREKLKRLKVQVQNLWEYTNSLQKQIDRQENELARLGALNKIVFPNPPLELTSKEVLERILKHLNLEPGLQYRNAGYKDLLDSETTKCIHCGKTFIRFYSLDRKFEDQPCPHCGKTQVFGTKGV